MKDSLRSLPLGVELAAFLLRIVVGWHFLYEGIYKVLSPNWSSAGYLLQSEGWLSSIFQAVARNPTWLQVVDSLNVAALIAIGLALVLGLFSRTACISGSLLLLVYFLASSGRSLEGHFLIVDRNLIEAATLILLAALPSRSLWGIDRLISRKETLAATRPMQVEPTIPREDNHLGPVWKDGFNRRELVKNLSVIPVLGGFVFAAARRHGWSSFEESNLVDAATGATIRTAGAATLVELKGSVPNGQVGELEISRLICGGNLISGFAHARDLIYVSPLLKAYFSDEKVIETLWLCETCGINTTILRTDSDTIRILDKYWKRGGKIQWIAQTYPSEKDPTGNIQLALENGACGAFVQGNLADRFLRIGRRDLIEDSIAYIQDKGFIAGTAAHNLNVIRALEESAIEADFYMKTVHPDNYWSSRRPGQDAEVIDNREDNYWDLDPAATVRYMKNVSKPWIAYKILAAGAVTPEEGFRFAFGNGADFACVGMFDFQVVKNVNTLLNTFSA